MCCRPNPLFLVWNSVPLPLQAKPTAAAYSLRDPNDVMAFLDKLVSWGRSPSNAWLQNPSCNGWSLQLKSPATPAQQVSAAIGRRDNAGRRHVLAGCCRLCVGYTGHVAFTVQCVPWQSLEGAACRLGTVPLC